MEPPFFIVIVTLKPLRKFFRLSNLNSMKHLVLALKLVGLAAVLFTLPTGCVTAENDPITHTDGQLPDNTHDDSHGWGATVGSTH